MRVRGLKQLVKMAKSRQNHKERTAFKEIVRLKQEQIRIAGETNNIPGRKIIEQMWHFIKTNSNPSSPSVACAVKEILRREKAGKKGIPIKKGEMGELLNLASLGDNNAFTRIVKIRLPEIRRTAAKLDLTESAVIEQLRKNILNKNFKNSPVKGSMALVERKFKRRKK